MKRRSYCVTGQLSAVERNAIENTVHIEAAVRKCKVHSDRSRMYCPDRGKDPANSRPRTLRHFVGPHLGTLMPIGSQSTSGRNCRQVSGKVVDLADEATASELSELARTGEDSTDAWLKTGIFGALS